MCPYCHADKRTEITYDCWTKVGDDELARSERCLRNEIRQLKERIKRLEQAGDELLRESDDDANINRWLEAKEAKL